MPREDGKRTKAELETWRAQHLVDADGDPAVSRQGPHYVPKPSEMLRGNFSLASFGTAETVVWWAAHENECDILEQLARDPRVDVNWRNEHGATPFYIAVRNGHVDAAQLMCSLRHVDFDAGCSGALDATPFWTARYPNVEMRGLSAPRGAAALLNISLKFW